MQVEKYDFNLNGLLSECLPLMDEGLPCSDMIAFLQRKGVSLVDSVEAISSLYDIDMNTSKKIVFSHPVWGDLVRTTQELHNEILQELKRL
jgi:L-fucose mutarotase/ribose pyranase (RbsD/FucU family)